MYPNLRAEMARYGVKPRDLAKALDITRKSIDNKMACKTKSGFGLDEAVLIRNTFFPELKIDDLFIKTVQSMARQLRVG
jgi:DNA-binding XRE family transcriptional regulator